MFSTCYLSGRNMSLFGVMFYKHVSVLLWLQCMQALALWSKNFTDDTIIAFYSAAKTEHMKEGWEGLGGGWDEGHG